MVIEKDRRVIRIDLQLIADMVVPGSRVLDVGCGDGSLLDYLLHEKNVDGRGIELSMDGVNACVSMVPPMVPKRFSRIISDPGGRRQRLVQLSQ